MGFVSWWKGGAEPPEEKLKPGLLRNFLDMPFFLKLLTIQAVAIGVATFIACFPGEFVHINDEPVTYEYVWVSGLIWFFMFSSLAWLLTSYTMLRRLKFSRQAYLVVFGLTFLWGSFDDSVSWIKLFLDTSILLSLAGLYLFKRKPVVEYFSKTA